MVALGAIAVEAAPFAYVAHGGSFGMISVIDTATNTVVATMSVGIGSFGVAITHFS